MMSDDEAKKSHLNAAVLKRCMLSMAIGASTAAAESLDSYDEAIIAYLNDQYETAIEFLKVSATEGFPQAKHLLGTMYIFGLGTDKDDYAGFRWFKEAADDGVVDAQFQVGLMYYDGDGTDEDEQQAMDWLSLAAQGGHQDAEEVLNFILNEDYGLGC